MDFIKKGKMKMFEKLPGFLSKFITAENQTSRGKAGLEVIKNNGEIMTAKIKHQNIINFPQADNRQALIAITQKMTDLNESKNEEESYIFRIESKKGRITKMFITNEYAIEMKNESKK